MIGMVIGLIVYIIGVNFCPNYKAGSKEYRKSIKVPKKRSEAVNFYSSDAWRKLRYRTLQEQGRRCSACRVEGPEVRFHVDHIKPRSQFPHLQYEPTNMQVLCAQCNMGKGDQDQTNWR